MLPGKKYTPEDIVRLAGRRAWLVIIPLVVATAAAVAVGERLPKKFKSDTLIMLVPQRIPDAYVKSAGSDNLEDRLATLEDQLLSRSRLERIILDLNLYPSLRNDLPMEDVVQRMRKDITITTTQNKGSKESTSFRIEYVSNDSKIAQKTTERLASLFIEENMRDRENVAEDPVSFSALSCRTPGSGSSSRKRNSRNIATDIADSFRRRRRRTCRRFRMRSSSSNRFAKPPTALGSGGCSSSGR